METAFDWGAAPSVAMHPHATSYFSTPEKFLDPRLFDDRRKMLAPVRAALSSIAMSALSARFYSASSWAKVYLAGSGASYQWSAAREPGDLDLLVGVRYERFRQSNYDYRQLSDQEISDVINRYLHEKVWPKYQNWSPPGSEGHFEVTVFVNPGSHDIRNINPYAAYDLTDDVWAVSPDPSPLRPDYDYAAHDHETRVAGLLGRYSSALAGMRSASNPVMKERHRDVVKASLAAASEMYVDLHEGRRKAFVYGGRGYSDPANARWQYAKRSGAAQALKTLHDYHQSSEENMQITQYGTLLPDTSTLVMRAMMHRKDLY